MSAKKSSKKTNATPPGMATGPMDVGLLEQLVRLMSANDLNTVDLRDGNRRVVLKRGAAVASGPMVQYAPMQQPSAPAAGPSGGGAPAPAKPADEDAGLVAIKSPMVGT